MLVVFTWVTLVDMVGTCVFMINSSLDFGSLTLPKVLVCTTTISLDVSGSSGVVGNVGRKKFVGR